MTPDERPILPVAILPTAILFGRRVFAWTPVTLHDGRRAWLATGYPGKAWRMCGRFLGYLLVWFVLLDRQGVAKPGTRASTR